MTCQNCKKLKLELNEVKYILKEMTLQRDYFRDEEQMSFENYKLRKKNKII